MMAVTGNYVSHAGELSDKVNHLGPEQTIPNQFLGSLGPTKQAPQNLAPGDLTYIVFAHKL